jgi:hypothetical protein
MDVLKLKLINFLSSCLVVLAARETSCVTTSIAMKHKASTTDESMPGRRAALDVDHTHSAWQSQLRLTRNRLMVHHGVLPCCSDRIVQLKKRQNAETACQTTLDLCGKGIQTQTLHADSFITPLPS